MTRILVVVIVLLGGVSTFGQGAHYTYPFTLTCPDALVVSGETVAVGVNFANGYTGERYEPTYSWTVSAGTIVAGQGTKEVQVQVDSVFGDIVDVTLNREFQQAHFPGVQKSESCRILIAARPAARMTDEFRTRGENCEEGLARLDQFLAELHNNPGSNGVIAFYGDTAAKGAAKVRELQLRRYAQSRKFDLSRLVFVRGVDRDAGTTQFWIVPPGAENPTVEPAATTAEPTPKLPYMHSATYLDGVPECNSYAYDLEDYARMLNREPKARARVVISETSRRSYDRELKQIAAVLIANGVSRDRIVGVYKYVRPNRLLESKELWIIPGRRR